MHFQQKFLNHLGTSPWQAKGGWGAQHSPPPEPFDFSNFRFWHFRFSILTFSIFDFDISISVAQISIWDTFIYHMYAHNTSRYVFLLGFCQKCHYFWNYENFDFCFFQASKSLLLECLSKFPHITPAIRSKLEWLNVWSYSNFLRHSNLKRIFIFSRIKIWKTW